MQTPSSSFPKSAALAALLAFAPAAALLAGEFHVATAGKDTNPGTAGAPFATVQRAEKSAAPGDTVFIHGGTYKMAEKQIARRERIRANVIDLAKSGRPGKPICYFAFPGDKPVFDFSEVKPPDYRVTAFNVTGSWLHFKGIAVTGVQVTITGHTQSICLDNSAYLNSVNFNLLCRDPGNSKDVPGYGHKMINNLNRAACELAANSFDLKLRLSDKDFHSLSEADLVQPRMPNGDLPVVPFMKLKAGNDAIDKGMDAGLTFKGKTPDLGAFEFGGAEVMSGTWTAVAEHSAAHRFGFFGKAPFRSRR